MHTFNLSLVTLELAIVYRGAGDWYLTFQGVNKINEVKLFRPRVRGRVVFFPPLYIGTARFTGTGLLDLDFYFNVIVAIWPAK